MTRAHLYRPPFPLRHGDLHTVMAPIRRLGDPGFARERIATPDDDFLDLDWVASGRSRAVILSHGLEGSSSKPYMRGMARALDRAGWDVCAWNYRGCSGVPNRAARTYHSGSTDDLGVVIEHVLARGYEQLALVGFSLGGNMTVLYAGQQGDAIDRRIVAAVGFSVPGHLGASAHQLAKPRNRIYMLRFLRSLRQKLTWLDERYPGLVDLSGYDQIRTFEEFDERYTAPLHGFDGAADYWDQCSIGATIHRIDVPTLIVNAQDDPFLDTDAHPIEDAQRNPDVTFELPRFGGHVGFVDFADDGLYWSERRARSFLEQFG